MMQSDFDWFWACLMGTIAVLVAATVIIIAIYVFQIIEIHRHCARWESKIVYQEAWTQYVLVGKVMTPIYHAAGNYQMTVCTEPR